MAKERISKSHRRIIRERANGFCEYCMSQEKYASQAFSIDHIIPIAKGGASSPDNLCLACQGCNNFKFTKTEALDSETDTLIRLFNPRTDSWKHHFHGIKILRL